MKLKYEDEARAWVATHPGVRFEKLDREAAMRFRYGGLVLTAYSTGTVLLQGRSVGQVTFKGLHCKSCGRKPLVIQGLEYMVKQAEKRRPKSEPPRQERGRAPLGPPVRLEDQRTLWEGTGRD